MSPAPVWLSIALLDSPASRRQRRRSGTIYARRHRLALWSARLADGRVFTRPWLGAGGGDIGRLRHVWSTRPASFIPVA